MSPQWSGVDQLIYMELHVEPHPPVSACVLQGQTLFSTLWKRMLNMQHLEVLDVVCEGTAGHTGALQWCCAACRAVARSLSALR